MYSVMFGIHLQCDFRRSETHPYKFCGNPFTHSESDASPVGKFCCNQEFSDVKQPKSTQVNLFLCKHTKQKANKF